MDIIINQLCLQNLRNIYTYKNVIHKYQWSFLFCHLQVKLCTQATVSHNSQRCRTHKFHETIFILKYRFGFFLVPLNTIFTWQYVHWKKKKQLVDGIILVSPISQLCVCKCNHYTLVSETRVCYQGVLRNQDTGHVEIQTHLNVHSAL